MIMPLEVLPEAASAINGKKLGAITVSWVNIPGRDCSNGLGHITKRSHIPLIGDNPN
jgi:hypothetical protein